MVNRLTVEAVWTECHCVGATDRRTDIDGQTFHTYTALYIATRDKTLRQYLSTFSPCALFTVCQNAILPFPRLRRALTLITADFDVIQ